MKRKPKTKKCKTCEDRKPAKEFGKMPHAKDGTGLNPNCRACMGGNISRAMSGSDAPSDDTINKALARDVGPNKKLDAVIKRLVTVMRATGTPRVTVDTSKDYVEVLTPERFALPEND